METLKTRHLILFAFLTFITMGKAQNNYLSQQVSVSGEIQKPALITLANIQRFNVRQVSQKQNIVCASGEIKKEIKSFKGVLLREIIDSCHVALEKKKERGQFYVYVVASDGYKVIFSLNELLYGPAADQTWLIFEENGKPITEDGRFVVICNSDKITGPRHVKWVEKIIVGKLD